MSMSVTCPRLMIKVSLVVGQGMSCIPGGEFRPGEPSAEMSAGS